MNIDTSEDELSDGTANWKDRFRSEVETDKNLTNGEEEKIWDHDDSPPSYDSLFGQFKEAKEKSDGPLDLLKKAIELFAGTIGCTIALCLLLALPITMIVIDNKENWIGNLKRCFETGNDVCTTCYGIQYKDDCPVEPFIPVYLIVAGTCGLLKATILSCEKVNSTKSEDEDELNENVSNISKYLDGVLNIFMFTWFIAGNIWVYSPYKPNDKPSLHDPSNYCNPTLYWFAFWVVTVSYVIMATICFCICFLGACASCTAFFVTK